MKMKQFGKLHDGADAHLYSIENDRIRLDVTDYGAGVVALVVKDAGIDVVQGFDSVDGYISQVPYMGASIGRVCNRIAKGTFRLNGTVYHTPVNNGPNTLHGGLSGFNAKLWTFTERPDGLQFDYRSADGEEGFPGSLDVKVTYELLEDGIAFTYSGSSDQDTLFAMTNHMFFNLDGPRSLSALHHKVAIPASRYGHVDKDGLAIGEFRDVQGTPFDFRSGMELGLHISEDQEDLKLGSGYDHHFCVDGEGFRRMVSCEGSRIAMEIRSDLPGFQMYSANFLDGTYAGGKEGGRFPLRSAVCFETQYAPNAINYDGQQKPILKKGVVETHRTEYLFKAR